MYKTNLKSQAKTNFDTQIPSLIDGDCDCEGGYSSGNATLKVAVANPDQFLLIAELAFDPPQCKARRYV